MTNNAVEDATEQQSPAQKWRHPRVLAVLFAGAVAGILSFLLGYNQSVWFDEGYTTIVISQPFWDMMDLIAVDVHPPLYYIALKVWVLITGSSAPALRGFSALMCAVCVIALYRLIAMLTDHRHALGSLPFIVLGPMILRYGYEIRMYSLLSLISVVGTLLLFSAVRTPTTSYKCGVHGERGLIHALRERRWWILYAIVVALGMYTHYIIILVWMTHALILWRCHTNRQWIFVYAFAMVLFLPWLPIAIGQVTHNRLPHLSSTFNLEAILSLLTVQLTGFDSGHVNALASLWLLILIVVLIRKRIRTNAPRVVCALRITGFCFSMPLVIMLFYFATKEVFNASHSFFTPRYASAFSPYLYAYLAILCVDGIKLRAKSKETWAAALLTILTLIGAVIGLASQGNYIYEQQTTPQVNRVAALMPCSQTSTIVAGNEGLFIEAYYYYKDCDNYVFLEAGQLDDKGGYAPLRDGSRRIRSLSDVQGSSITLFERAVGDRADIPPDFRIVSVEQSYGYVITRLVRR